MSAIKKNSHIRSDRNAVTRIDSGSVRVLQVADVSVHFGQIPVLRNVSLNVQAGEIVGLIGPNGAGKTTLMRAIMTLIPMHSGNIAVARQIGYVPQRQDLDWNYPLSVEQLVYTAFISKKVRSGAFQTKSAQWAGVYRALRQVELYDLRKRTINELSGGQKQRVLIARALAPNPKLMLLDEPFTGLDHPNQDALSELFRQMRAGGVGILMSTHDLTQAVDLCDQLVMLNQKIIAHGSPATLTDPNLWMRTFKVRKDSALLRMMGLVTQ